MTLKLIARRPRPEFLLLELVNSTISDVVSKHQVSYDLLRGVLTRYVSDEVDWSQFEQLRMLGLDEISLLKGQRDFVTIVSTQAEGGRPVVLPRPQRTRETDGD